MLPDAEAVRQSGSRSGATQNFPPESLERCYVLWDWIAADLDIRSSHGLPITRPPDAGDILIVRDGIPVGGKPFIGEKYQLELFLPDI